MNISGFQPLSLLDYPGVIASIIFTQGCPFRCVYCHNPDLIPIAKPVQVPAFSEQSIIDELKRRSRMIEGVCITGGEPTIHHDLPDFIQKFKRMGLLVKLDTNGMNPRMIERLITDRAVDYLAMDLKHVWNRYAEVIGIDRGNIVKNCQETMQMIQGSGIPHEFRTTVYAGLHSEEGLVQIAEQLQAGEHYALQAIRYGVMHVQDLPRLPQLNIEAIAGTIRSRRPDLTIEVR